MTSNEQQIILNAFQAAEMSREEEGRFLKLWKPIAFNRLYTPPLATQFIHHGKSSNLI